MQTFGYARPSAFATTIAEQQGALEQAGCSEIVVDRTKGVHPRDLKKRFALLNRIQPEDTLVVFRLECLAVSGKDLLETLSFLIERRIHLQVLHDNIHSGRDVSRQTLLAVTLAYATLSGPKPSELGTIRTAGRTSILRPEDWPKIRGDIKVMSTSQVARQHNVSRSTLYNYLKRMEKQAQIAD